MTETYTTEGVIPHLAVVVGGRVVLAPVKLALEQDKRGITRVSVDDDGPSYRRYPRPMRRDGKLVYALPGGVELEA